MWPNQDETEDLVIFTKEILNQKLLCSQSCRGETLEMSFRWKHKSLGAYYASEVKPHFIYLSLCIFVNVLLYHQSWLWLINWFFIKLCRSMNAKIYLEPIISTVSWVFTYNLIPFLRLKNFPRFRCFPQTILVKQVRYSVVFFDSCTKYIIKDCRRKNLCIMNFWKFGEFRRSGNETDCVSHN